jgi:predicted Zn-dependent protease
VLIVATRIVGLGFPESIKFLIRVLNFRYSSLSLGVGLSNSAKSSNILLELVLHACFIHFYCICIWMEIGNNHYIDKTTSVTSSHHSRAMEIIIKPLMTRLNDNTLNELVNHVSREFEGIRVTIAGSSNNTAISTLKNHAAFQYLFDTNRNQWNSPKLLDWLYDKFKPNKDRIILVILDVDAYSHGLNFVLGEAFPKGGLGAVYLARIKEELYGLKPNHELL